MKTQLETIDVNVCAKVTGGTIHGKPLPQPTTFQCSRAVNGQWVRDVEDPDRSFPSKAACEGR